MKMIKVIRFQGPAMIEFWQISTIICISKMVKSRSLGDYGKVPAVGIRHLQCFLLFWGVCFAYGMRVNFSLGIVAMTDKKSANPDFEEYDWSEKVKSLLLSSFFWGYVVTQIPGGYFARRFGGKLSLGVGVTLSSLGAILTPVSARIGGWQMLFAVRVLQGLSQGMIFPSCHTLLAKWTPSEERAVLGTYAYCGSQMGTVVMFISGGFIASSPFGWPGIFYISGGLGLIWLIFWYLWGASSPRDYKTISIAERTYIEQSIASGANSGDDDHSTNNKHLRTPWLKFLTSMPVWALLATHSAFAWAFWTMLTQIPAYMKNVLGFNIKSNAVLSALPYFTMLLLNFVFSALASLIGRRHWLSLTNSRKLFNTLSMWVPAFALAWLGFVDASQTTLAVFLLVIAVGFGAAIHMGFMINHIDLSPNFAGIMLGSTNMIANLMSIFAPLTVGFVVSDEKNPVQWRIVFFISAAFCFFGNLLFIAYGSAEVQPWNQPERTLVLTEEPQIYEKEKNKTESL